VTGGYAGIVGVESYNSIPAMEVFSISNDDKLGLWFRKYTVCIVP